MIKRTIEISSAPAHLSVRRRQLVLERGGEELRQIPLEDAGMVVVDHPQTTYTHSALSELAAADAVVVLCGADHLPCGILLPLANHSQVVTRLRDQIRAKVPVRKRLWRQIVRAKILAQARLLADESIAQKQLVELARQVRSGDISNREGVAAKIYWSAWLSNPSGDTERVRFRRDCDGGGLNGMLNYGYAILRAALARAIVSGGLQPAIGLHHKHRSNAFCLADDLIEPLRPFVDERVRELHYGGVIEVDRTVKESLLDLIAAEARVGDFAGPLMVGLHRYVASLSRCLSGEADRLEIPTLCN